MTTPAAEIKVEKLFTPVPLVARITTGVSNIKELIQRQREAITEQAAAPVSSDSGGVRPPEARVGSFKNNGSVSLGFSSKIKFPADLGERIKAESEDARRRLADGKAPLSGLIEVFAIQQEESESGENSGTPLMDGWELVSLTEDGIDIKLNFTNPVALSGDDQPDLLLIQLDLSEFEDENGNKLPDSLIKYMDIPTQMGSEEEAKTVNE